MTMPSNYHELIQGDLTVPLTVHWAHGDTHRLNRGDRDTPELPEPDHVVSVEDEEGNDITDWACSHIGEWKLINENHTEIETNIQIPNQQ